MTELLKVMVRDHCIGIPAQTVERVIPAVAITPLPGSPDTVLGLINFHGKPVAVLDLCRILGLVERPILPSDFFVICQDADGMLAVVVDDCPGVENFELAQIKAEASDLHKVAFISGGALVVKEPLEFLSKQQRQKLSEQIDKASSAQWQLPK